MLRSAWVAFALVSLGLWASLLPQITYSAASSGEPDGDVLVAWPGWSVQQDLGSLRETVGTFQIWASTVPSAFRDATVNASLIDASTRAIVRQAVVRVSRSHIPARHTLSFPSYVVPSGQRLMLQLGVANCERCHVIYRLSSPASGHQFVMLNGVPGAGSGPLAFAHISTGSGLRAGIGGEPNSRSRLVLAVLSGTLAIFAHPLVGVRLRQVSIAAWRVTQRLRLDLRRLVEPDAGRSGGDPPSAFLRLLRLPWYPWIAAAVPILHFLAVNPLHFSAVESLVPLAATLAVVTCGTLILRLALKDWHRSAAISAVVVVVVFGYGHAKDAIDSGIDDRAFFGGAVVLTAATSLLIARLGARVGRWNSFCNLTTAVLLAFPVASVAVGMTQAKLQERPQGAVALEDLLPHPTHSRLPDETRLPDIYYIILDSYARNDALVELFSFDNADFLLELENRGFYVASEAASNYMYTIHSTPSILNMQYLDGLGERVPRTQDDLVEIARRHSVGAVLKNLGYTYIHLESGVVSTQVSSLADRIVLFTPSGRRSCLGSRANRQTCAGDSGSLLSARFSRALVQSTALQPLLGDQFLVGGSEPYEWWSPHRALQMFDFLSTPIETDGPKFVFAHIVKPHDPATFDKDGNYIDDHQGFDDYHDPSVASAYVGQLIFVNKLVLEMIDAILGSSVEPPIIVIAGDHGRGTSVNHRHSILAAFHLPHGGSAELHPTISSVNHFRYILDFYFQFNLGLLDDRSFSYSSDYSDFRR